MVQRSKLRHPRSEQKSGDGDQATRPYSTLHGDDAAPGDVAGGRRSLFAPGETLRIAVALDAVGPPRHAAVLNDLFWTLYSKLAAVLESHRVVCEVSRWISSVRSTAFPWLTSEAT